MSPMIDELLSALGERVLTDPADMAPFTKDASQVAPEGLPQAVVVAHSTEDVSTALAWANRHQVPVSVWSAGSGVAGGALSYRDGLVVALHELNEILDIDAPARLATVQAGVITGDLDRAAREHGLFYAPDPASSEISTVGGNIATNAGGLKCVAYGTTAVHVAALTVVLADGSVIRTGSRTVKNATGLNLTQLFVGSEGTLGIITEATVWLTPVPQGGQFSFLAGFDSVADAGRAVVGIVGSGAQMESLELIDGTVVEWIEEDNHAGLPPVKAALLLGSAVGQHAESSIERAAGIARDTGATTVRTGEGAELLAARKKTLPSLQRRGVWVAGDVGVPVPCLPTIIGEMQRIAEEMGTEVRIVAHAGDGNLHPMVRVVDGERKRSEEAMDRITQAAIGMGGVITGEHGIGMLKHHELDRQFDEATLRAQHAVKAALDPHCILTPGRAI